MTTAIKRRRGTTTQHSTFTGLEGEITIDTTKDTAVVHDGATAGGRPLLREDLANNAEVVTRTGTQTLTNKSLNGTLGATTPSTVAATTISASGVSTFSAGSAGAPALTTTGDTNTGIFFPAADTIAFSEGGVESMRIDSSGNVGIGTSPSYKLDVLGTINSSAATATGFNLVFRTSGITTGRAQSGLTNTSGDVYTGIEGSTAGQTLTGSAAYSGFIGTFSANPFYLVTNSTIRMTLDSSGNLGLGVTPSAWQSTRKAIDIGANVTSHVSSGGALVLDNNAYADSTGVRTYKYTGTATEYQMGSGTHTWFTAPSGTAGNAITFTQAMTLHASGGLSIGNTTDAGASNLSVTGGIATAGGRIVDTKGSNGGGMRLKTNGATVTATTGTLLLDLEVPVQFSTQGGFSGMLCVSNAKFNSYQDSTQAIYSVSGRGTTATFTLLNSTNGSLGAYPFTLDMSANGVIRFTNTQAVNTYTTMVFTGVVGNAN